MKNTAFGIEAVVMSVDRRRRGKEYAVTKLAPSSPRPSRLPHDATVTFSLSEWESEHVPKAGQIVILKDIEKFANGWRARSAVPLRA